MQARANAIDELTTLGRARGLHLVGRRHRPAAGADLAGRAGRRRAREDEGRARQAARRRRRSSRARGRRRRRRNDRPRARRGPVAGRRRRCARACNELDEQVSRARRRGRRSRAAAPASRRSPTRCARSGEKLPAEDLSPSDAIVPPEDLSLAEARELLVGRGLHPRPAGAGGVSREVVLAARPAGEPRETDFELREAAEREPADGEVARPQRLRLGRPVHARPHDRRSHVRRRRSRSATSSTAAPSAASSPRGTHGFAEGDWVLSRLGWREQGIADGDGLRKLDAAARAAVDRARRARHARADRLGRPRRRRPRPGGRDDLGLRRRGRGRLVRGADREAQGAARDRQRRVAREGRVAASRSESRRSTTTRPPAKDALADGIDVYFDNVGGTQLESALFALRPFGRVIACGAISRYNDEGPQPGPRNLGLIVTKRLRVQGFIVTDHMRPVPRVPRGGRPLGARRQARLPRDDRRRDRQRPVGVRRAVPRRQHRQDARPRRAGLGPREHDLRRAEQGLRHDREPADDRRDATAGRRRCRSSSGRPAMFRLEHRLAAELDAQRVASPSAAASAGARRRGSRRRRCRPAASCRRSAGSRT